MIFSVFIMVLVFWDRPGVVCYLLPIAQALIAFFENIHVCVRIIRIIISICKTKLVVPCGFTRPLIYLLHLIISFLRPQSS